MSTTASTQTDIPEDKDYVIRTQTPEEIKKQNESDIPEYRVQVDFSNEQKDRLKKEFFLEFDAFKAERTSLKLEEKWKEKDAQYNGELAPNDRLLFNVHVQQSKVKGLAIIRALSKAFLASGQIADVSPRPGMAQTKDGYKICDEQSEFIDYAFDEEIKPHNELKLIWTEAYKKFVGIGRVEWSWRQERRKRMESYNGKNVIMPVGQQLVLQNEGLQEFLSAYPNAKDSYKSLLQRLVEEKKVNIVVDYKDTVQDNAKLRYVKLENFYVRNSCNYWEGLKTEHCIVEREEYSYWELKKKEKDGEFEDVDAIWGGDNTNTNTKLENNPPESDYKTANHKVLRGTYYFKMDEADDEEIKIVCWFGEEKKNFLGAILYPWWGLDTDYIPFFLRLNEYGFYGNCMSVMDDLKDSNIAQDAILSLLLHGAYARSVLTPITKEGSLIEQLILEKDWVEGMPLSVDEFSQDVSKELSFVEWPQMNINEMLGAIGFAQRTDSALTGINDAAATGANDPTDPSAPAHKTLALMQASGINIEDYIETILPSFNLFIEAVMQLYYQMSNEDRQYRVTRKAMAVTGANPFKTITRTQMIAKTNIQSRAAGFVFEKAQERQDNMAGMTIIKSDSYASRIPQVQYKALALALSALGPRWKNFAENDLPSPEELDKQLKQVTFQAVSQFMNGLQQQQQTTGVAPQVDPDQLQQTVEESQAGAYNPALAAAAQKAKEGK